MTRLKARRVAMAAALAAGLCWAGGLRAEAPVLYFYNWVDYIAPETIPAFEKETGIKVNYATYDNNETLEAKLAAGKSGYDLVVPTLTPFLARQIQAGFYLPLDKGRLANYPHLNKALLQQMAVVDKGNAYAIPWTTGTDGIAYNEAMVKQIMPDAPVDSLKLLFDPDILGKFKKCGVSFIDSPTDVFPAALSYLGLNPDSKNPDELKKAAELLLKIRPYIRKFDSSEYINDMANGDLCIAWGYSSDLNIARQRAREAGKGVSVVYVIPKEGTMRWIDTMAIPKDAPNPEAALKFLDFIMRPEIMAQTSNKISIQSGNADATPFVAPAIANDPGIFPPPSVEATLYAVTTASPEIDRLRTRLWTRIKTNH